MAKQKMGNWPRKTTSRPAVAGKPTAAAPAGQPTSKTAAARKYLGEHPEGQSNAEIIDGVKKQYGFDIKLGDVSNAKTLLKKAGGVKGLRKVKTGRKRESGAAAKPTAIAATLPEPAAGDVVSATLDLVAAVGLEQARAIIAGLGK